MGAPDGAAQDPAGSKSIAGLRRVVECVAAQQDELVRQRDELAEALRQIEHVCQHGNPTKENTALIAALTLDALARVPA